VSSRTAGSQRRRQNPRTAPADAAQEYTWPLYAPAPPPRWLPPAKLPAPPPLPGAPAWRIQPGIFCAASPARRRNNAPAPTSTGALHVRGIDPQTKLRD